MPSPAARAALHEIYGLEYRDPTGQEFTVCGFAVIPNDASPGGHGPVVLLESDGVTSYLPVETDGDVADLFERVLGEAHPTLGGDLSAPYRAASR